MIIIFIIYFIFLVWLFEFIDIENDNNQNSDEKITIIIDYINNLEKLFLTIDSIKDQKYPLDKINLIILDSSKDDIHTLINNYKYTFQSIDVVKITDINRQDTINNIKSSCNEYILFIDNEVLISKSLIPIIIQYIEQSHLTVIFLPLLYRYKNPYHKFYQLFHSFIESIKCSLINKNFNLSTKNIIINKKSFFNMINGDEKWNVNSRYLISSDLYLYKNEDYKLINEPSLKFIHILYSIINFLFLFALLDFIAYPSQYFLFLISIKIIPELCFIYTFYNRLQIKFPKLDYLIFCIIGPFYSIIELTYNQITFKK
tara:strand:+ start:8430 stop:9374 length:945 start_codon:yes stop_codon:yes gene_type:complete